MKRLFTLLITAVLCLCLTVPAFAFTCVISAQSLTVNGNSVRCEKYNIDGSNYFKLRDLAQLLNGTGSQFDVGWDAAAGVVSITTHQPYTQPNGTELVVGEDKSALATESAQTIMIDGEVRTDLTVYNIGGNNFFKLREMGDALGFDVDYDAATSTMLVWSREPEAEAELSLSESTLSLSVGQSATLVATVSPEGTPVRWSSSSPDIAAVEGGLVVALSPGIAAIFASAGSKTVSCTVTVSAASVTLGQSSLLLNVGETAVLAATVYPEGTPVSWASSAPEIAIVDNGRITGLSPGTAVITATAGGSTATCTVTVSAASITLSQSSLTLSVGETATLTATVFPEGTPILWTSSAPDVASVEDGRVTALSPGTAVIAVTAGGSTVACTVTVSAASVTLDQSSMSLKTGESRQLTATTSPSGLDVSWSSSNTSVATVSASGLVTAVGSAGSATITAAAGGSSASCTVTIQATQWYTGEMYRVGTDLPAGDYYAVATSSRGGYICKYSDSMQEDIEENENFPVYFFFRTYNGQYLKLSRCKITALENAPVPICQPDTDGYYPEGYYRVGIDIPAGEYRLEPTSDSRSGYYCAYSDITHKDIVKNGNFKATTYYTVKTGQYFKVSHCKIVCINPTSNGSYSGSASGGASTEISFFPEVPDFGRINGILGKSRL